jgi:hypothetical protein
MGLFDKVGKVLLLFDADTKPAEEKIKHLSGVEKFAAEASLSLQKQQNESFKSVAHGLAELEVVWGGIQQGIGFATDAWNAYKQAAEAAGGADAKRAKEFQHALDEWDRSLQQVKVSIGEMVVSLGPAIEALSQVVALAAQAIAMANHPGSSTVGGSAGSAIDWINNHFNVTRPLNLASAWIGDAGSLWHAGEGDQASIDAVDAQIAAQQAAAGNLRGFGGPTPYDSSHVEAINFGAANGPGYGGSGGHWEERGGKVYWVKGPAKKHRPGTPYDGPDYTREAAGYDFSSFGFYSTVPSSGGGGGSLGYGAGGASAAQLGAAVGPSNASAQDISNWWGTQGFDKLKAQIDAFTKDRKRSVLEAAFGEIKEWDAYTQKMELLGTATQVLSSSLNASFDAWDEGSATAKQALGQFFKSAITGIAEQLFAYGVQEEVQALLHLAIGDVAGAGAHASAGAAAMAGAAVVGGIARTFNGGGGGAGGGNVVAGGGGGSTGPRAQMVINAYIGDVMSDNSPRRQAQKVAQTVERAKPYIEESVGVRR